MEYKFWVWWKVVREIAESKNNFLVEDSKDFVERLKSGDPEAFEEFFLSYKDRVFRSAYNLCDFDKEAALDLTQDVFLKVFESIKDFDGKSQLFTWIYRIIVSTYLMQTRKKRLFEKLRSLWKENAKDKEDASPLDYLTKKEDREKLIEAMKKLTAKQQIVFKLKFLDNFTIPEISNLTGMAEGTVKAHLFRAIKVIRKELEERGFDV